MSAFLWLPNGGEGPSGRLRPQGVYLFLALLVVVQGINWPFMAIGLRSVSAVWMSAFRLMGATLTLFALTASTRRLVRPPRQDYPVLFSIAIFRMALTFILVYSALDIVPPGRSSILGWSVSLWTVPIAVVFVNERMYKLRWLGLAAGIGGLLLVFEPTHFDWTDGHVILGHAMLLGAAIANAGTTVHLRHHAWRSTPLRLLPWQFLAALVPILALALFTEGVPSIAWTPALVAIVLYQGVMTSGFAMWAFMTVLRSHEAISTNLALMGVPVVGLLSSALLLDEPLGIAVLSGLGLVIAGVAINGFADSRYE